MRRKRVIIGSAVVLLLSGCGGSGTRTGSTAASVGPAKLSATFVSPWYGYSVGYPMTWTTTNGKGPWPRGQVLRHDDPGLDVIEGSTKAGKIRFVAASQPVPAGTTARQFGRSENPFTCPPGDRLPRALKIDGVPAFVTLDGCPSQGGLGGLIWDVVVVSSRRGYDFTIDGELKSRDAAAWLASIRLHPASARS